MKWRFFATLCVVLAALVFWADGEAWAGDDGDWEVETAPQEQAEPAAVVAARLPGSGTGAPAATVECGEQAVAASGEVTAIVGQINRAWHSNVHVYQSVIPSGPHARRGGCIFYNPDNMSGMLSRWMNIKETRQVSPMLYAIFAHEV